MNFTTYGKGQTDPPMLLYCVKENGQSQDLTGLSTGNLSLSITAGGVTTTGLGSFQITSFVSPCLVQYTPNAADFTKLGQTSIKVVITNGSKVNPSLPYSFVVE